MTITMTKNGNGRKKPSASPGRESAVSGEPVAVELTESAVTVRDGGEAALDCLRRGLSEERILSTLRREHGFGPVQAAAALERACAALRKLYESRVPVDRLVRALEQREHIVEKAIESSDYRVALSALESRDKLLGLAESDLAAEEQAARSILQLAELARSTANMTDAGRVDG